jgi:hypothetical protein
MLDLSACIIVVDGSGFTFVGWQANIIATVATIAIVAGFICFIINVLLFTISVNNIYADLSETVGWG